MTPITFTSIWRQTVGKRASIAGLFCAAGGCLFGLGTTAATAGQLAFSRMEAPASFRGTLTFSERVAYQHAIEEVYWRHRIWPKDNLGPKPSLDEIMSRERVVRKVNDYLSKSQLLTEHWQSPITPEQLQAEMDRMARETRQPEVLRELFEALGNDPFVIAECLARPILAEGVVSALSLHARVEAIRAARALTSQTYTLPEISVPLDPADDTWSSTITVNAPDARAGHTAVWTGSEMIIWGGATSLQAS